MGDGFTWALTATDGRAPRRAWHACPPHRQSVDQQTTSEIISGRMARTAIATRNEHDRQNVIFYTYRKKITIPLRLLTSTLLNN
jgi:hypothetical protein